MKATWITSTVFVPTKRQQSQAYSGDSTINIELGLRTAYLFNRTKFEFFIDANIISLGDEIEDGPLVDSSPLKM
ncbi:hypothetical protein P4S73_01130 [Paraglaciecola sp. Hal342]